MLGGGLGWTSDMSLTGVVPPHGWSSYNSAGVEVSAATVISIGVVQRCIEVIQNSFFEMGRPEVFTKSYDKDGHWFPSYLMETAGNYPSLFQGSPWGIGLFADNAPIPYNFGIGKTITSMALFGEAWWYCTQRDYLGKMQSLEVLHPAFLVIPPQPTPAERAAGKVWKITYGSGANATVLDPNGLVNIPKLVMPGDLRAVNPIQSESAMFAIALAALQYSLTWFSQGASPSFMLTTDNKLDPDAVDKIYEKLVIEHSGLKKANLPLVFDSGLKYQSTQMDPNKSQMSQTLAYSREEISGWFGIPGHLVGIPGGSGGNWGRGLQEENYGMLTFTLSGYRNPVDEAFTSIIARGLYATTSPRNLLHVDEAEMATAGMNRRMAAVTTPNEERRKLQLPPVKNGDDIETPMNSNRNVMPNDPLNEPSGDKPVTGEGGGAPTANGGAPVVAPVAKPKPAVTTP
jgi:hypothetical protein